LIAFDKLKLKLTGFWDSLFYFIIVTVNPFINNSYCYRTCSILNNILGVNFPFIILTFFCIRLHNPYRPLHIPGNARYGDLHKRNHRPRIYLHRSYIRSLLYHCPNSLVVQRHNILPHIPYLTGYNSPSSLPLLPGCRRRHNDCTTPHILNMLQYISDGCGSRS